MNIVVDDKRIDNIEYTSYNIISRSGCVGIVVASATRKFSTTLSTTCDVIYS